MTKRPIFLILLFIFVLGVFLRFYRIEENFVFSGEVGHNLLAIKNAYESRSVPLLGPPTSHPWLSFGPLFYWLYGPVLIASSFNPLSHAYFGAFLSVVLLIVNFIVIKQLFRERVATFSTFLIAISPLFMEFARNARFFAIVTLLVYPFVFLLYKIYHGGKKYRFWLGLVYGAMFSFHFTPLMLLPVVGSVLLLKRVKTSLKDVLAVFVGFLVTMLPFFIYDSFHGLTMTRSVILWIPYRVAGFLGLYPKNNVSSQVLEENLTSLSQFITKSFLPGDKGNIGVFFAVSIFAFIIFRLYTFYKLKKAVFAELLLYMWLGWGVLAVFIHGSPPIHYFVPLLPLPIIVFALLIESVWTNKIGKVVTVLFLFTITVVNLFFYFSNQWFYRPLDTQTAKPYYMPFVMQREVALTIIQDARNERYMLHRLGIDDQFEEDYAQNYLYLLWLYGNEPVKKAGVRYTIYENDGEQNKCGIHCKASSRAEKIFKINNVVIVRDRL